LRWRPRDAAADDERYQVLSVLKEKVREITDHRSLGDAMRAARRAEVERLRG
jgi:hypothetical protein